MLLHARSYYLFVAAAEIWYLNLLFSLKLQSLLFNGDFSDHVSD